MTQPVSASVAKVAMRRELRRVRREVAADPSSSALVRDRLSEVGRLDEARVVLSFVAVPGEPDLAEVHDRLRSRGAEVVLPDPAPTADVPDDVGSIDVVIVPGVAFTIRGDRLGQGGGWFDRLLARVRPDCLVVGVCFDAQIVPDLPVEPHDVRVHVLVTESTVLDCRPTP
ncbi:MAG: 5-formyltetrahydrofolate cyclo-ligase [Ilumatobacteraceae bacterium]